MTIVNAQKILVMLGHLQRDDANGATVCVRREGKCRPGLAVVGQRK
jgi:hypothetical protein